jgi:hypothetical protein
MLDTGGAEFLAITQRLNPTAKRQRKQRLPTTEW